MDFRCQNVHLSLVLPTIFIPDENNTFEQIPTSNRMNGSKRWERTGNGSIYSADSTVVPLRAGSKVIWRLARPDSWKREKWISGWGDVLRQPLNPRFPSPRFTARRNSMNFSRQCRVFARFWIHRVVDLFTRVRCEIARGSVYDVALLLPRYVCVCFFVRMETPLPC